MSADEAHEIWRKFKLPMEFRCVDCKASVVPVNIKKECENNAKAAYFRSIATTEHRAPCPHAEDTGRSENEDPEYDVAKTKGEFFTKLVEIQIDKLTTRSPGQCRQEFDEGGSPSSTRNEEHTTGHVAQICRKYLETIKGCYKFEKYKDMFPVQILLPGMPSRINYAEAFWRANAVGQGRTPKIFYGRVKQLVTCADGWIITFDLPKKIFPYSKPTVILVDSTTEGYAVQDGALGKMFEKSSLQKSPYVFIFGFPVDMDGAVLIQLQNAYWIHFDRHPNHPNSWPERRKSNEECASVLPKVIERELNAFRVATNNSIPNNQSEEIATTQPLTLTLEPELISDAHEKTKEVDELTDYGPDISSLDATNQDAPQDENPVLDAGVKENLQSGLMQSNGLKNNSLWSWVRGIFPWLNIN